jgi:hypothetical protein
MRQATVDFGCPEVGSPETHSGVMVTSSARGEIMPYTVLSAVDLEYEKVVLSRLGHYAAR